MGNYTAIERSAGGQSALRQYRKQAYGRRENGDFGQLRYIEVGNVCARAGKSEYQTMTQQGMRAANARSQNSSRQSAGQQYARQQAIRPASVRRQNRIQANTGAAQRYSSKRRRKKRLAVRFLQFAIKLALVFCVLVMVKGGISLAASLGEILGIGKDESTKILSLTEADRGYNADTDKFGEKLAELLERNEETADYVKCYPDREVYQNQSIDLIEDLKAGEVPLLLQWDKRWGYNACGDSMIGLAGCGPVCLDMAYLYFTGDSAMTPREMAAFVCERGYYKENVGTKWSLWTEGVGGLGLRGEELPLDESSMQQVLDSGGLVICSMGPGDFTTDGHFILIRGYDENGFYVNDPNRRSTSSRQWDFDTLCSQIRNLWSLYEA